LAVAAAVPKPQAAAQREEPLAEVAGSRPTGPVEAAAAAERTAVAVAVARPIGPEGALLALAPPERARSAEGDLAGSAPVRRHQAQLLPKARRKKGKTCWWAGWLRHTACRRS